VRLFFCALVGLSLFPWPAFAWNRAGHMVSGAIAYSELQRIDAGKVQKVVTLLKNHPDYNARWKPILEQAPLSAMEKDQYLFALAARWPDDIRGIAQFDHPTWHYVNIPFTPGTTGTSLNPTEDSILTELPRNIDILKSSAAVAEKAVAFCWFEHLAGDIHQPLHATKLITAQYPEPEGDRGGTRFYVRVRPNSSTISLHKFWDDLVQSAETFRSVRNKASDLRSRSNLQRSTFPQLAQTRVENWAKDESFKLARSVAYRNSTLAGSSDKADGTVLPADYPTTTKPAAERQIVLAGYRMADFMQKLF
jgi:S1/P1 Nuclease